MPFRPVPPFCWVIKEGGNKHLHCTPRAVAGHAFPRRCMSEGREVPEAQETADLLNRLISGVAEGLLADHPLNIRPDEGEAAMRPNSLTRGARRQPPAMVPLTETSSTQGCGHYRR